MGYQGVIFTEIGPHFQVFYDRQLRKDHPSFGRLGHSPGHNLMGWELIQGPSLKQDFPRGNGNKPGNGVKGGGFTRSIGA